MSTAIQNAPTKAVAVKNVAWDKPTDKSGLEAIGKQLADQMNAALPKFLQGQAPKMIRALIMTAVKTPKLMECTPITLFGACLEAARLGLEIGGYGGQAYLVPFKGSATLVIGYKGLVELAWRSQQIKSIESGIVREKDAFDFERGSNSFLKHKDFLRGDRGPVQLYYVMVKTVTGSTFELMSVDDAIRFRNRYALTKSGGPWYECEEGKETGAFVPLNGFNQMALKTVFKKLCRWIPQSPEFRELHHAKAIDDDSEQGKLQAYQESVPLLTGVADPADGTQEQAGGEEKSKSEELRNRMKNSSKESEKPPTE